jgi:hypothetical protein
MNALHGPSVMAVIGELVAAGVSQFSRVAFPLVIAGHRSGEKAAQVH